MCHAFYSRKLIKLVIQSFKLSASKYCYILELYCTVDKCTVSAVTIRAVLTARDEIMGKGKDSRREGKKKCQKPHQILWKFRVSMLLQ